MAEEGMVPDFKSQPWVVFDTVVAKSYLLGDTSADGLAVGSQTPAINSNGEMVFFSAGRTEPQVPWYTNVQLNGQLAYGFEVWGAYLLFGFPPVIQWNSNSLDPDVVVNAQQEGVPPALLLTHALLNFSILKMNLGQENQFNWPSTRFGAGGGLTTSGNLINPLAQNSLPQRANVMTFPEPIEIPRTQPLDVKLQVAPEARNLIGTPTAPGVGLAFTLYHMEGNILDDPGPPPTYLTDDLYLEMTPYSMQFGYIGRRIKHTQYGQVPSGPAQQ